jgi:deoxyribodipyrimidine photo-lyase
MKDALLTEAEGITPRPIIVWFRRDLRTDDHAALAHAAKQRAPLVPLFIFDSDLIRTLPCDGAAFNFQAEALAELGERLGRRGGALITRRGAVLDVHRTLIRDLHPQALYYNRDYEPYGRERDHAVERMYHEAGIDVHSFKDTVVHEPDEVLTGKKEPYVVFTPYANSWKRLSHPAPFPRPGRFSTPQLPTGRLLGAGDLGKTVTITAPAFVGGEREAHRRWQRFLHSMIGDYGEVRDRPSMDGTSMLSAYLRFGCISIRRMLDDCEKALLHAPVHRVMSIRKFVDELIWREFYISVLYHFPQLVHSNYRREFDAMPWRHSGTQFNAWKEGRTGFPLVDAGMRQLNQTGWMHNRVRMVVASFLTKDLRHDWKKGAAYFEEKLMDIELSSNNGGWQWAASTGVDPKPLRIFNPRRQSERFDQEGEYIKRYVPELRHVPQKFIHAPHLMPPALQKELGCRIGKDYPPPIVDHAEASAAYKRMFAAVKQGKKADS